MLPLKGNYPEQPASRPAAATPSLVFNLFALEQL